MKTWSKKGSCKGNGGPGGTRTPDNLLRRQMLYPAELRARGKFSMRGVVAGERRSGFWLSTPSPQFPPQ